MNDTNWIGDMESLQDMLIEKKIHGNDRENALEGDEFLTI
jgi:hypothetical protein